VFAELESHLALPLFDAFFDANQSHGEC